MHCMGPVKLRMPRRSAWNWAEPRSMQDATDDASAPATAAPLPVPVPDGADVSVRELAFAVQQYAQVRSAASPSLAEHGNLHPRLRRDHQAHPARHSYVTIV